MPADSSTTDPARLSVEEAGREYRQLQTELVAANAAYHQNDAPIMSDADYDARYRRALALEAAFPALITPESLSQRVGAAVSSRFAKITHRVPMLSLAIAFPLTM